MLFNNKDSDSKQRFSIRKLSIGACSVLLSTVFFVANNSETVHAKEDIDSSNVAEQTDSPNARLQAKEVPLTNNNNENSSTGQNAEDANSSVETPEVNQSAEVKTPVVKDDAQEPKLDEKNSAAEATKEDTQVDAQEANNKQAVQSEVPQSEETNTLNTKAAVPISAAMLAESKVPATETKDIYQTIDYPDLSAEELASIPDAQKGKHKIATFEKIDGKWVPAIINAGLDFTPPAINNKVGLVTGIGASQDHTKVSPIRNLSHTARDFTTTIRYIQGHFAKYEFIDTDDDNKVVSEVNVAGRDNFPVNLASAGVTIPANYKLAAGAELPQTLMMGADISQDMNNPTVYQINLVHHREKVTEVEVRKPVVHYVYANGDQAGQEAAPDAELNVRYVRTGIKDLVTGTLTPIEGENVNWHWDNTYNENGYQNGYKVINGNWTLPQEWGVVSVDVPTVAGYNAITTGDWEVNKDGSTSSVPANQFVFPTYAGEQTTMAGQESVAYTPGAALYEAQPEHTVYFAQGKYDDRRVTAQFHYWKDGHDAGEASPDQVVEVLYTKPVTAIHTHGSKDMSTWTFDYADNYVWDQSRGGVANPGFNLVSGSSWHDLTGGSSFGIDAPNIEGYTAATSKTDSSNNTLTFANPKTSPNTLFTNDTDPTWYNRNKLTTYYVPSSELTKTVTRTINYTNPDGFNLPYKQEVTFNRVVRLNDADNQVLFGGLIDNNVYSFDEGDNIWNHAAGQENAEGTWPAYVVNDHPLVVSGYTTLIDGKVTSNPSIPAETVKPDTNDEEIAVSFIKNGVNLTLTGKQIDYDYNGKMSSISDEMLKQITVNHELTDNRLTMPAGVDNVQLTAADFRFTDVNGKYIGNPTDAGTYHIVLSEAGLKKFQDLDTNFSWNYDPKTSYITYKINPVNATATLSGKGARDYNKNSVSKDDLENSDESNINITLRIPGIENTFTVPLDPADFNWQTSDGTVLTTVPSDAGTYKLTLNDTGFANIQNYIAQKWNQDAKNVLINKNDVSGSAQYIINKQHLTATLSGSAAVKYTGSQITGDAIQNAFPTIEINVSDIDSGWWMDNDWFVWKKGNDSLTEAPTNVGEYQITLSKDALAGINEVLDDNNYIVDKGTGGATITVTPADATLSLTGNNGTGTPYTGSQVLLPLADLQKNTAVGTQIWLEDGSQPTFDTSILTDDDFDWYDGNTKLDEAPTNAGSYTIKLKAAGLKKFTAKYTNYNFTLATNSYGFKINKVNGHVAINNDYTDTYTGTSNTDVYKNYTLTLTTDSKVNGDLGYTLQAGDLIFKANGKTYNTPPVGVGQYTVSLSKQGWTNLKAANNSANINWVATEAKPTTRYYTINPYRSTAKLTGSASRPYNGSAVSITDINKADSTIGVTIALPNNQTTTYKLVDGDYTWNTPKGSAPINVGNYTLSFNLTAQGKANLQNWLNQTAGAGVGLNNNPNVLAPTAVTGEASFAVTALDLTVNQAGHGEKTYNGSAADVTLDQVKNGLSATGLLASESLNVSSLTADDFDWYDEAGTDLGKFSNTEITPKNAGSYTVRLNEAGIQALKDANENYNISLKTNEYQYAINKANAVISLDPAKDTQEATWTGSAIAVDPAKFAPSLKDTSNNQAITLPSVTLTADDYTVDGDPVEPGNYNVTLTEAGWQKVANAVTGNSNYNWLYSGNGILTINKASAEITLSGEDSVIYSGQAAQIPYTKYQVTLSNGQTYTLKDGDLEFVQDDHTNVGDYQLKLSEQGLENIRKVAGNHYNYTYNNGTVDLHVTPATATYQLSGSQNHTYNGKAGTIDLANYQIAIQLNNGQTVSYTLQDGDLEILDGPAINRKSYNVALTQAGLDHLKQLNANYDWDANNSKSTATFEVTPAEMTVGITGEANAEFNGSVQPLTQAQVDKLALTWAGLPDAPEGITFPNLKPSDLQYTEKQADGSYKVVDPLHAGTYQVGLTAAAIERLNKQYPNGNYTFILGKSTATYIINQHKAKVTLSGYQTAAYTQAQALDPTHFTVKLTDPTTNNPVVTYDGPLVVGDLEIDGYTGEKHPVNVGSYQVKITEQLMDKLKAKYTDYDFSEVKPAVNEEDRSEVAEPNDGIIAAKNNDGLYIITPINAYINLAGSQTVDYDASGNYTIDTKNYSVSFDDALHQAITTPDDFKLGLEFDGSKPTDVGTYKVSLDKATLEAIGKIGYVKNELGEMVHNYEWITDGVTPADYVVQKLPVTVTVANAGEEPQSSIYGQPISLDNGKYQITLVDKNGKNLTYTLQAGDLAFTNGVPTTAGTFDVQLSNTGIENIEKQYPAKNYDLTNVHTATYVVEAATPTITITLVDHDGHGQKVYDAQPAEIKTGDFTIALTTNNGQTLNVDLNSDDLEFKNVKDTPTNVGSYDVVLKDSVISNLKKQFPNYNWKTVAETIGQYTITAAHGSAKLSGSVEKPYDGSGISDLSPIKVTVDYPGVGANTTYTLTNNDFVIVNNQTHKQYAPSEAPADVGDYQIELTDAGKANIAKLGNSQVHNINWDADSYTGEATYKITAIAINVSGNNKQQTATYDGSAFGNTDGLDTSKFVPTLNAGEKIPVPEIPTTGDNALTADDYTIKNSKGETVTNPTDAGEYTVWLNENGLTKLKGLSGNFTWPTDPIQMGTLLIKSKVTFQFVDDDKKGEVVKTTDPYAMIKGQSNTIDPALEIPDNYVLASGQTLPTTYTPEGNKSVVQIHLIHETKDVTGNSTDIPGNIKEQLNDEVTRTINYEGLSDAQLAQLPAGQKNGITQTVKFIGSATYDLITKQLIGKITWNVAEDSQASYAGFTPHNFAGYTATVSGTTNNEVPAFAPQAGDKDSTVTISYTANEQTGKISYVDDHGKEIGNTPLTGNTDGEVTITPDIPAGWEVVPEQKIPETVTATPNGIPTVTIQIQPKKITVTPDDPKTPEDKLPEGITPSKDYPHGDKYPSGVGESDLHKTITRTIIEKLPSGEEKTEQTVIFTRTATIDLVTGEVKYGEWTKQSGAWSKFTPEAVSGYTASPSEIEAEEVNSKTQDKTVTITYTADEQPGGNDGDGDMPTPPTPPDNPGQGSNDNGGTTPPNPSTPVQPTNGDSKHGEKPGKPTKPEEPGKKPEKPGKPTKPTKSHKTEITVPGKAPKKRYDNVTPPNGSDVPNGLPAGTHWKNGALIGPNGEVYYKNGHWSYAGRKALPQTGAHDNMLATVFGSLATGLGILGLLGVHKKKKDE